MNRVRRSTVAKRKPIVEADEQDDDFESDEFVDNDKDFSASEDEWLPKPKGSEKGKTGVNQTSQSDSDEAETTQDDEDSEGDGSGSEESVVASRKNYSKKRYADVFDTGLSIILTMMFQAYEEI